MDIQVVRPLEDKENQLQEGKERWLPLEVGKDFLEVDKENCWLAVDKEHCWEFEDREKMLAVGDKVKLAVEDKETKLEVDKEKHLPSFHSKLNCWTFDDQVDKS